MALAPWLREVSLLRAALLALLLLGASLAAGAADEKSGAQAPAPRPTDPPAPTPAHAENADAKAETAGSPAPIYQPPKRGTPAHRVSGSVRGPRGVLPDLQVLVPDHIGQTVDDSPSLFWFVDGPLEHGVRFEFTLVDEGRIVPLVEKDMPSPQRAGIYRIRLADLGVKLTPGGRYQWSVAIVRDPEQRSQDVLATGWIERVEEPAGLAPALAVAGDVDSARAYAELGLWYDALTALGDEIERHPDDPAPRATRDALLRQVGLDEAASAEAGDR